MKAAEELKNIEKLKYELFLKQIDDPDFDFNKANVDALTKAKPLLPDPLTMIKAGYKMNKYGALVITCTQKLRKTDFSKL